MHTVEMIASLLEAYAPTDLAEEWDNVGLLVGDPAQSVHRVMTCLTVTPTTAAEAVDEHADLIVAHHPLPFRPLQRLTTQSTTGRLLLDLAAHHVALYSPHTAFDSAAQGINQSWAEAMQLSEIVPLVESDRDGQGAGRRGVLSPACQLGELIERVKRFVGVERLRIVGKPDEKIERVAVACGSGGSFLDVAQRLGCDCLITGETNFHTCLEAEACGISLLLTGHFASERFAVEHLAEYMASQLTGVDVWASRRESDPLCEV